MDSQFAETSVLSILLKNPDLVEESNIKLKANMFSSSPNRNLYYVMTNLSNDGLFADETLVISTLESKGLLSSCGGEGYIKFLSGQSLDKSNLEEYCKIVINSYKAREITEFAANLPSKIDVSKIDITIQSISDFVNNLTDVNSNPIIDFNSALKESWDLLVQKVKTDQKIQLSTGIKELDSVTGGYFPGEVWVIAGRPGMGKSAFMCNSVMTGHPTLIFSREMSRNAIIQRFISIVSGVPIFNLRIGLLNQEQLDLVSDSIKKIKDLPIHIDTNFETSPEYITSITRKYHDKHGINTVHIDYLQVLCERGDESTHEIGRITRNAKLLANSLDITQILYSQLNRMVELRQDKRPILSDLRQSGNIEEDVDVGLFLYRDIVYNPNTQNKNALELLLRKQRQGPTGIIISTFDEVTNKIG